ncbi:unnamed protein product [Caenorhabditis auriculariae]|uniref:Uncharacterized protein n=1 Tax=Caenorhabditis auriculariae TaxID=2777116 RepID=A0A8S1H714_9PELO|nr:unnamed protein product [Caenorhabditis auriculariae]
MPLTLNIIEQILDNAEYRSVVRFSRSSTTAKYVAESVLRERKEPTSATVFFDFDKNRLSDAVCVVDIQNERKSFEWENHEGYVRDLYTELSQFIPTHVVLCVMSPSFLKRTGVFAKFVETNLFRETKTLTFDVDKRTAFRSYGKWFPNIYRFDGQRHIGTLAVRKQFRGVFTFRKFIGHYPAAEFFRISMYVSEEVIMTDDCLDFIMEQHRLKKTPLKVFVLEVGCKLTANVNKVIEFLDFAAWSCTEYKSREPETEENGAETRVPRCYIEIHSPFQQSDDDSATKMKFALQRMGITPTEMVWKTSLERIRPVYTYFCWAFKLGGTEIVYRLQVYPYGKDFQNINPSLKTQQKPGTQVDDAAKVSELFRWRDSHSEKSEPHFNPSVVLILLE